MGPISCQRWPMGHLQSIVLPGRLGKCLSHLQNWRSRLLLTRLGFRVSHWLCNTQKCLDGIFQNVVGWIWEIPVFMCGPHWIGESVSVVHEALHVYLLPADFHSWLLLCLVLSQCVAASVYCWVRLRLTLALEENEGRNAAGGPEEEGSNWDGGRGPLVRNSAGLKYRCCMISVQHWYQHGVTSRDSATPPRPPLKF